MMRWERVYLRIGGNGCRRRIHHRNQFHQMIIEGCLHQSIANAILLRITEPICLKLNPFPLKQVNEGRSVHSYTHSISLFIVNVFL